MGHEGVKYAIDPVVGETGTPMYQALGEEGRMLIYGSLTSEPMCVEPTHASFWQGGASCLHLLFLSLWCEGRQG